MATQAKKVKRSARDRNKFRIRKKIYGTADRPRVSVFRSSKHIYAQVIADQDGGTIVSASTLEKEVMDQIGSASGEESKSKSTKSVLAANIVGAVLAKRCKEKNISKVVFDRNGFVYKGRVRAVAEGARKEGLDF